MHGASPGIQRIVAIQAYAHYPGIKAFEAVQFRLIRRKLRRANAAESEGNKGKYNVFLAAKITRCQSSLFAVFRVKSGAASPTFKVAVSARLLLFIKTPFWIPARLQAVAPVRG